MAITEQEAEHGFTFYTYTYGDDPAQSARQFYESLEEARKDLVSFRNSLIKDGNREQPLRDMKIVQLCTKPVSRRALVELFNGMHGNDFGGFIRSCNIVEVVSEPQLQLSQ